MMKTLLFGLLFLTFSLFPAQLKKVDIADFYNWTSNSGTHYQFVLLSEKLVAMRTDVAALVRVRYSMDGGVTYKIAEFDAKFTYDKAKDSDNLVVNVKAAETARILKGDSGYIPDNFTLYYDKDGEYIEGYQADHDELTKKDTQYAKVFLTPSPSADHMRKLIRLFYDSSEPLYRDLMVLAAQYD
ncbi:hypothetical protein OA84_02685 [Kaistella solincola]|uniref:DUF4468 domain-containing protein n=1 Tax=Kaistella solincola TaxID=510955 RepID=A0ABR4ZUU1_9FLAO|nr:hypothetical protein [Kaistella solincola]KIA84449.1 hypothetical protein OA84_02685 [Kaistella solincola]